MEIFVTDSECFTAVGHSCPQTTTAARAGINRYQESEVITDNLGEPAIVAPITSLGMPLDPLDKDSCVTRLGEIAALCLSLLLRRSQLLGSPVSGIHFLLGVSTTSRPGPRYEGLNQRIALRLADQLRPGARQVTWQVVTSGHAAAIEAVEIAGTLLTRDPGAVCVLGGLDSLIEFSLASWLEDKERLKTASFGRNHGLPLGEAVGFLTLATSASMRGTGLPLARLAGWGTSTEPAPFLSATPTTSAGLTEACGKALATAGTKLADIDLVVADLTGEFHRARDWAYAEHRNLAGQPATAKLWHPADAFGCIGAASGVVQLGMAAYAVRRGWARQALVTCADDSGPCGATVLKAAGAIG